MANDPPDPQLGRSEDRPLECSECKKPIAVRYTEVVGNSITHTVMCADCPHLEHRLHGIPTREKSEQMEVAGLCCGNCGTTLQSVRMGSLLGCSECYVVFGDVLLSELIAMGKLSSRFSSARKSTPIHIGRGTGEVKVMTPTVRLLALNEALSETIQREDYEQAAWLRDQIKQITEIIDE
ncbi:MAG: hypothetical protein K940chlam3_01024 [Chlamydiae bacterium]|nr:hypothetical protein [Chlamydiota bacterium]